MAIKLTLAEAQKVRWYKAAKRKATKFAKRQKELDAQVRAILGDATVGTDDKGNTLIEVKPHPGQKRADLAILEHLFPEAYAATVKATPYTYLK